MSVLYCGLLVLSRLPLGVDCGHHQLLGMTPVFNYQSHLYPLEAVYGELSSIAALCPLHYVVVVVVGVTTLHYVEVLSRLFALFHLVSSSTLNCCFHSFTFHPCQFLFYVFPFLYFTMIVVCQLMECREELWQLVRPK